MPQAVGSLETRGFPPVLAAADAMVKSGLLLEEDAQRIAARAARVQW